MSFGDSIDRRRKGFYQEIQRRIKAKYNCGFGKLASCETILKQKVENACWEPKKS